MVQFPNSFSPRMPESPASATHSFPAPGPDPYLTNERRLRLLSDDELEGLPPLNYLVQGMVPAGGFIVVVGASGGGKTFFVLDLAMSIATGTPWHGRDVVRGPVVYVAGEGISGLVGRVSAWKDLHGCTGRAGLFVLPQATALTQPDEVNRLLLAMEALPAPPQAVIIDTLARNMGEGDENSARDVARLTAGVDRIREATGAAVILVHHTGLKSERERGSSALRGNADTTILLRGSRSGLIRLDCAKQKDGEPFATMALQLDKRGDSCVLLPAPPNAQVVSALSPTELRALRALAAAMPNGLSYSAWANASGAKGGAFDRIAKAFVRDGLVAGGGGRGVPFVLTPNGVNAAA